MSELSKSKKQNKGPDGTDNVGYCLHYQTILLGNYHNMFLGILTLILFMVPQFIDKKLGVTIPVGLETVILIFIFSAEILGEINAFYVKIPVWDTIFAYNEWIPDGGNRVCAD